MSWNQLPTGTPALAQIHFYLVDQLSDTEWTSRRIWAARKSVFEWTRDGIPLAFDVHLTESTCEIDLLTRRPNYTNLLQQALKEAISNISPSGEGRFRCASFRLDESESILSLCQAEIVPLVKQLRQTVDNSFHNVEVWHDPSSNYPVHYSHRASKKDSKQLIVIFSSIRSNRKWLDFGGPAGTSLGSNRARLLFIHDDIGDQYTYNLMANGFKDPLDTITKFLRHYFELHGFTNENVTLAGMSKGGTSAIIHGLRVGAGNIVALAPQLLISRYLDNNRPEIIQFMLGNNANRSDLDRLILSPSADKTGLEGTSHLHILTSDHDPDCVDALDTFSSALPNWVKLTIDRTASSLASTHHKTVLHLTPLLISLLATIGNQTQQSQTLVNSAVQNQIQGESMNSDPDSQVLAALNHVLAELKAIRELNQTSADTNAKLLWEARTNRHTQNVIRNASMSEIYSEIQALVTDKQRGFIDTVNSIREGRKSFARFGDGELRLMLRPQYQLKFQRNSVELSNALKSIFTDAPSNLMIGFPHLYREQHWSEVWSDIWRDLAPFLECIQEFGNSHVSRPIYFESTGDKGLNAWRQLWNNQSVAVITGRGSTFDLVPELFSNTRSTSIIGSVPENAFQDLQRVQDMAEDADADLNLISLGPAGTVLAHKLAKQGRWAIDIGHISDSYRYAYNNGDWPEAQYHK